MQGGRPPFLVRLFDRVLPPHEAFRRGVSLYPPYLGAGIVVTEVAPDFRRVVVELRAHVWNRNYVGTHFGGSLYSMTDPFFMLMLMRNLGPDVVVWDKAGAIRFRKPGRGTVRAVFELDQDTLDGIAARLASGVRSLDEVFHVTVTDADGGIVAELEKTVYVRRKASRTEAP